MTLTHKIKFYRIIFVLFGSLSLYACTSPSADHSGALTKGTPDKYADEFVSIVETVEENGLRPLKFDQKDRQSVIRNILHRLDSRYVILHESDVDRIVNQFSSAKFTRKGYLVFSGVIDEFSTLESQVFSRDILPLLENSLSSGSVVEVAGEKPANTFNNWASSNAERLQRLQSMIQSDLGFYEHYGYGVEEVNRNMAEYYSRLFSKPQAMSEAQRFEIIANAVVELVDSNSSYYLEKENFNILLATKAGLGLVLAEEAGVIRVSKIIAGGSAEKAGTIKVNDLIVGISQDGETYVPAYTLTLEEAVENLRGEAGTSVFLKLRRGNTPLTVEVARKKVMLQEQRVSSAVESVVIDGQAYQIGVITVPSFYIDFMAMRRGDPDYMASSRDVKRALNGFERQDIDGLLVDLRNNGGGSLQEGNMMAGLFIEWGPIVQILHGQQRKIFRDGKREASEYFKGPLVILVNEYSAGASEILAGAVQDYGAGLIVGRQTFGLGVVQSVTPTKLGSLKLTEGEYFRVSGVSYQLKGVTPDVMLPPDDNNRLDRVGQKYKRHSIQPGKTNPVKHARYGRVPEAAVEKLEAMVSQHKNSDNTPTGVNPEGGLADPELSTALMIATHYAILIGAPPSP